MTAVTANVKPSSAPSLISAMSSADSHDTVLSKAGTFSQVLKETKVATAATDTSSQTAKTTSTAPEDKATADSKAHARKQAAANTDALAMPVAPQTLAITTVTDPTAATDAATAPATADPGMAAAMLALINAASPKTAATAATNVTPTTASTSPVTGTEAKTTIGDDISDAMASAAKTASALSDAVGTASAASGFGAVLGLIGKGVATAADALASIAGADSEKKSAATPDLTQMASQLQAPDAATAPVQLQSTQVVGTPAFAQELGDQIAWMGNGDVKEASIRLNPQDMGQLDVKISMHQNRVDVAFTAQHPNAVQAVTQTLTQLDTMLAHHGLQLGQTQVGQQQGGQGGQSSARDGNSSPAGTDADDAVVNISTVRAPLGLVDDFA
jgi:flagellar hook-length control protein FliK